MKNKFKIIFLLTIAISIVSCSDEFLNTEPTGMLSSDDISQIANRDPQSVLQPLISGLYSTTFAVGTGGLHTGSDNRNDMDYGQKNIDLVTDIMSCDVAVTAFTYGWYDAVSNYTDQSRTGSMPYAAWRYYYRLIKSANEVLDLLGGDTEIPEDAVLKSFYGQAKAMRAYAYFYLINLYQHPYDEKKDNLGVPIYRTQLKADMHKQSTVNEVYELIIGDLEQAVTALNEFDRAGDISRANKDVVFGLLANAYLFTGEYKKAADAADAVIATGKYPILPLADITTNGFNSVESSNWIWGVDVTKENTGGLINWWAHVDLFTYGYASAGDYKAIDEALYALIPPADERAKWFGKWDDDAVIPGETPLIPVGKFFDPGKQPDSDKNWTNDFVYMRIEEMHLIKAEALARAGELPLAKEALKVLLSERNPEANVDALSQSDFLETIYLNWRIEMWGEGKSYLALKRFKATAKRADNHALHKGATYSYNDKKMIFEIPEREQLNNPNIAPQD